MSFLNRDKLLEKEKLQIEKVNLENNNFTFVRQMSARERDKWEGSIITKIRNKKGAVTSYEQNLVDLRAKLAVNTICDKDGNLELKPEDYVALSQNMSAKTMETIVEKAQELNKISDKDKEELVKNLEADQSGDSTSDSV